MANRPKRQHYIPRFLLNRFASRSAGKKRWIWQIGRNGECVEVSTRDVALGSGFYGPRDSPIETGLSRLESEIGPLFNSLPAGPCPKEAYDPLRRFVYTLCVRTRSLRKQLGAVAEQMLYGLGEAIGSPEMRNSVEKEIDTAFDQHLAEVLSTVSPRTRAFVEQRMRDPGIVELMKRATKTQLTQANLQAAGEYMVAELKAQDAAAVGPTSGQRGGLNKLLDVRGASPSFLPVDWEVLSMDDRPLVLGDSCAFTLNDGGEIGSLFGHGGSWTTLYLPIAPDRLLVARNEPSHTVNVTARFVNQASVEMASDFVYGASMPPSICELAARIGTRPMFLSEDEVTRIMRESLDEL